MAPNGVGRGFGESHQLGFTRFSRKKLKATIHRDQR